MDLKQTCALLLSRQGLRPSGNSLWIRQLYQAIQWIKKQHFILYTSLGQKTWEMIVFLAQQETIEQVIVIPSKNLDDFEYQKRFSIEQFCLDLSYVHFQPVFSDDQKSLLYCRDQTIVSEADIILPISVRKKGHMADLISWKQQDNPETIINHFQVDYEKSRNSFAYHVNSENLSPEIYQCSSIYLIHWTRTSNHQWPTELLFNYYDAILNSNNYPRNALATLENILKRQIIKASSRHMPKKTPTVSFSELPPKQAINLMRWRSRYRQMSFEPYGIGIDKKYAQSIGIQEVHYYKQQRDKPDHILPWLCQSEGKYSDWRLEKEFRFFGDLDISHIPRNKLICFCLKNNEAKKIYAQYRVKAMAITK